MKLIELRQRSLKELELELLSLLREQFNLKIQLRSRKLKQTHLLKRSRKNIVRIKTIITEKKRISNHGKDTNFKRNSN